MGRLSDGTMFCPRCGASQPWPMPKKVRLEASGLECEIVEELPDNYWVSKKVRVRVGRHEAVITQRSLEEACGRRS